MLKNGPQVTKTVEFGIYGNPEKPNRQLQFHRFETNRGEDTDSDAGTRRAAAWSCENDEVDRLLAFLHSNVARTGRYQVVDRDSPAAALLELLGTSDIDAQSVVDALAAHADVGNIITLLAAASERGLWAAQSAVLEGRRELVSRLRQLVDDPATTETEVQTLIGKEHWIFGGRYVGVAERRSLTMLDQHDIPLLGSDGTLHVVELKGPSVNNLIVRHRNHWIVGPSVHEAAAQCPVTSRSARHCAPDLGGPDSMADDQAVGCHPSWPVGLFEEDRASCSGPVGVPSEWRRELAALLIVSG